MEPKELFQQAWEQAARRVNAGRHSRDSVQFFLTDGTTKEFVVAPMRDDAMQEEFLRVTLQATNNHPVEAIMLNFEVWFEEPQNELDQLDDSLAKNSRPSKHHRRREGVNFYLEKADGTIVSAMAEIRTVKRRKRVLDPIKEHYSNTAESRLSHFFKKAREGSIHHKNIIDEILGSN